MKRITLNIILSGSQIKPVTVARFEKGYHDKGVSNNIASATYIRNEIRSRSIDDIEGVLDTTKEVLKENIGNLVFPNNEKIFQLLKYKILTSDLHSLSNIFSVGEGIENKIVKEIRNCHSLEQLIDKVKSKRYTRTRIQRILMHTLVSFTKEDVIPKYIRVLGFNRNGSKLIKEIKKKEANKLPIVTNINKEKNINFDLDIRANDIYNLITGKDTYKYSDFVKQPIIINWFKYSYRV